MKVEKNTGWLGKKIILLIIIIILFLLASQILSSQNETIQTDKAQYQIGETVHVVVNVPDITSYRLYYEYEGFVQRYMGDYRSFSFMPLGIGTHYLVLRDTANNEIIRQSFEVIGTEEALHSLISLVNSKKATERAEIKAYDGNNNEINLTEFSERVGLNRIERLEIVSDKKTFNKIVLRKLLIDSSINLNLGVDKIPLEKVSVHERAITSAFAIDASELNFTNGSLTRTAEGTELWKCKEWDFENQQCLGSWQKIMDLTPGQDYELEISPEDPGYAETNITILNVHSYPTVGGNWTVAFNTTGTADLSIKAVNGTTWNDYSESGYDLKFLQASCGASIQAYEWVDGSVFIANYSCNETGYETSKALTPGVHNLEFTFGSNVKYAYNNATIPPLASFVPPTLNSGIVTYNTSVPINVSISNAYDLDSVIWNWNNTNTTIYDDSLFMLYNFDNNSAIGENTSKAIDASRSKVNATIYNATWISGRYGMAINFSKSNGYSYVNTSNANSVKGLTQATIAMWINPKLMGVTVQDLYHECIGGATGTSRFTLRVNTSGGLYLAARGLDTGSLTTLAAAPNNITANQWQYVVGIYDNVTSYHRLYINGRLVANTSIALAKINISNPLSAPRIGNHNSGTEPFNGTIDEVMMWNRTLSSQEVLQLYMSNLKKFNSTQWYLYVNQTKNSTTGLDDGFYTYQAYVTDNSSNTNWTEQRNITIDTAGPNTTLTQPLNFTNITTNTYTLNATVTDMTGADTVIFLYRQNSSTNWSFACSDNRDPSYNCDWDLTGQPDSPTYEIRAYANDTLGNVGNNDTHTNITVDRTAPAITNVVNDSINSSSARINWTTDEEANGSVKYGTTLDMADGTSAHSDFLTQHNITLLGLTNSTLYYYNITSCGAQGLCSITGPYNFTTAASNSAPTIDSIDAVPDQTPIAEDVNYVPINFTVTDVDGIADLNHSSAKAVFSKDGITRTGNCSNNTIDSDSVRYNCSVAIQYYDPAGTWAINVSVWDLADAYANNTANTFDFQELLYISLSSTVFGFGEFFPGQANQPASSNPLFIDNMGNVNLTQINITAYNLVNGSFAISASNFTVNVSNAPGTHLQHTVSVIIPSANVSVDVNGVDANASLYFYISTPNVPPLNYTSSSNWVITAGK